MRRLSGAHLVGTMMLASALIMANWDRQSESAPRQLYEPAHSPFLMLPPSFSPDSTNSTRTVLRKLRRGTRIAVGSLDVSGSRHTLTVTTTEVEIESALSLPAPRYFLRDVPQRKKNQETVSFPPSRRGPYADIRCDTESVLDFASPIQIASLTHRVFLTPHFYDTSILHKPSECEILCESRRFRMYLDHRLRGSDNPASLVTAAERLLNIAEFRALPIVEAWIGLIRDVDQDQKLSVVITNLDQRSMLSSEESPIHGCIRTVDFESDVNFGGDIVYLDSTILELPPNEQSALLTHELTHAAICSMGPHAEVDRIPTWLNEATAHIMELQNGRICPGSGSGQLSESDASQNLQRRINAFYANPSRSPIVADEHVMNLAERRSGSRGAATLFLASWLTSPDLLNKFLNSDAALEDRIEDLTGRPFADVFREWTLSHAGPSPDNLKPGADRISTNCDQQQFSLLGTAFRCFECADDVVSLVIESDASTQLQISIIEPDECSVTQGCGDATIR